MAGRHECVNEAEVTLDRGQRTRTRTMCGDIDGAQADLSALYLYLLT